MCLCASVVKSLPSGLLRSHFFRAQSRQNGRSPFLKMLFSRVRLQATELEQKETERRVAALSGLRPSVGSRASFVSLPLCKGVSSRLVAAPPRGDRCDQKNVSTKNECRFAFSSRPPRGATGWLAGRGLRGIDCGGRAMATIAGGRRPAAESRSPAWRRGCAGSKGGIRRSGLGPRLRGLRGTECARRNMPPMAGWSLVGTACACRVSLARGVRYRAEFRPTGGAAPVVSLNCRPTRRRRPRWCAGLPKRRFAENQLKFYAILRADEPRRLRAHPHRDAAGASAELPFRTRRGIAGPDDDAAHAG